MPTVLAESREKQRLNFDFSAERVEELKQLLDEAGGGTMKDLINNALTLLEWSITETKKGNEIAAVNEQDQTFRVLVTPLLQRVKKLNSQKPINAR
jgi:hypothetical protein